jgi:multiple sugar transport system permease protein
MGYASALAWLLFVIIVIITAIQVKVGNKLVYYEGETRS